MAVGTVGWFLAVSLLFSFFSLFRNTLSLGLLERPLFIGFFWGILTNNFELSINVAIFFELFWLDLIPVGTFIPPHLTAATFAALALTTCFHLAAPGQMMVILFSCLPLAWLGAKLEGFLRERQRKSYNKLLNWARRPHESHIPGQLILRSAIFSLLGAWVVFFVTIFALHAVLEWSFVHSASSLLVLGVRWPHLWIAASLGGVMALRLKRVYVLLLIGIGFVLFFSIIPVIAWQSW